jgi:hypothetical protein
MQPEAFLSQAGMLDVDEAEGETGEATTPPRVSAEEAIRTDPSLTPAQRDALLAVYRSFSAE